VVEFVEFVEFVVAFVEFADDALVVASHDEFVLFVDEEVELALT
jgi:hypothetical protein